MFLRRSAALFSRVERDPLRRHFPKAFLIPAASGSRTDEEEKDLLLEEQELDDRAGKVIEMNAVGVLCKDMVKLDVSFDITVVKKDVRLVSDHQQQRISDFALTSVYREMLNNNSDVMLKNMPVYARKIQDSVNERAVEWGVQVKHFDIGKIHLHENLLDMQNHPDVQDIVWPAQKLDVLGRRALVISLSVIQAVSVFCQKFQVKLSKMGGNERG